MTRVYGLTRVCWLLQATIPPRIEAIRLNPSFSSSRATRPDLLPDRQMVITGCSIPGLRGLVDRPHWDDLHPLDLPVGFGFIKLADVDHANPAAILSDPCRRDLGHPFWRPLDGSPAALWKRIAGHRFWRNQATVEIGGDCLVDLFRSWEVEVVHDLYELGFALSITDPGIELLLLSDSRQCSSAVVVAGPDDRVIG